MSYEEFVIIALLGLTLTGICCILLQLYADIRRIYSKFSLPVPRYYFYIRISVGFKALAGIFRVHEQIQTSNLQARVEPT
jgi:hypothetical protein